MTFGLKSDEAAGVAIMDKATEAGVDFFDTSHAYPLGGDLSARERTEEIIGRWLAGKRDQFILATKCFVPMGPAPMDDGNSRRFTLGYAGPMDQERYWHKRMFDTVEAIRKYADEAGVPLVTLSVAWVLATRPSPRRSSAPAAPSSWTRRSPPPTHSTPT